MGYAAVPQLRAGAAESGARRRQSACPFGAEEGSRAATRCAALHAVLLHAVLLHAVLCAVLLHAALYAVLPWMAQQRAESPALCRGGACSRWGAADGSHLRSPCIVDDSCSMLYTTHTPKTLAPH